MFFTLARITDQHIFCNLIAEWRPSQAIAGIHHVPSITRVGRRRKPRWHVTRKSFKKMSANEKQGYHIRGSSGNGFKGEGGLTLGATPGYQKPTGVTNTRSMGSMLHVPHRTRRMTYGKIPDVKLSWGLELRALIHLFFLTEIVAHSNFPFLLCSAKLCRFCVCFYSRVRLCQ